MTGTGKQDRPSTPNNDADRPVRDSDPMLDLLRGALSDPPRPRKSLLPRIQDRIRTRTRGRYFRDRYSHGTNPLLLILIISLLVLLLSAAIYLILQPLVDEPKAVDLPPAAPKDPRATPEE